MGSEHRVIVGESEFTPQEISGFILGKIKKDIQDKLQQAVSKVVITVPAYFDDNQRQATIEAGKLAGFDVMRIISEPTAAALAYGLHREDIHNILVWDLGGGTFDVSILELGDGVFEVKAVNGNTHLGGDDWDQKIVEHLIERIRNEEGIDITEDRPSLQRLKEAAEKAKIKLSSREITRIRLPFVSGRVEFQTELTRYKFNELGKDILRKMVEPTKQAMADARLSSNNIDRVVLVGGSTRMPAVQNLAKELFQKEPYRKINPDEVVAIGAAVQAGILLGEIEDVALVDVTPLSMGIETQGGIFAKLIERNSSIPISAGQIFTTAKDNQAQVDIRIFQGERALTMDNIYLGEFILEDIPLARRGTLQIEVTFHIDQNGILSASALDLHTEIEKSIVLKSSQRMTEDQINRSIKEAERYSEEDEKQRTYIQLGIQAENMIAAAEVFVEENEESLNQGDVAVVRKCIFDVQNALAGGDPDEIELTTKELKKCLQSVSDQVKRVLSAVDVQVRVGV